MTTSTQHYRERIVIKTRYEKIGVLYPLPQDEITAEINREAMEAKRIPKKELFNI